ncbi:MAG: aldolase/citrate lyase family protein, partial [Rhodobacteraceae bacterium]|nr:aldolase/citrate lyase family protein [Paracoccaceae bacterium]
PADLAADMGHPGQPGAEPVQSAIRAAILAVVGAGKAAGILTSDSALARSYLALGATFVAVGSDVGLLGAAARSLRASFVE